MRMHAVLGNTQRLDGGAMFGHAPKALWARWFEPDASNRIALSTRALLICEGDRNVLLETGIGAFFEPALRERYGVEEEQHVLLENLARLGLEDRDIDVVVLSHLHFDHAGGLLARWAEGEAPRLLFPEARFVVGKEAYARAKSPHPRDRASFIEALPTLLEASGRLTIVDGTTSEVLGSNYRFRLSNGHTPGMLLTEIKTEKGPLLFAADLIPGVAWVRQAITMGYDRFPERLIDEKTSILEDLLQQNGRLFYTHDPATCMSGLSRGPKGRIVAEALVPEPGPNPLP